VPIWQPVTHLIYNEELTLSPSHPLSTVALQQHYAHTVSTHPMTYPYNTQSLLSIITKQNYVQPFLSDGHLCFF